MKHREAVELLEEFREDRLDSGTASSMADHVRSCSACGTWLETYELLADAFDPPPGNRLPHPQSDVLALCAVRPEEMYEPDQVALRHHLERCGSCWQAVRDMRESLRQARPSQPLEQDVSAAARAAAPPRRLGLAAAVVALLLVSSGSVIALILARSPRASDAALLEAPSEVGFDVPRSDEETMAFTVLEGRRVIQGSRRLAVSEVSVRPGADIVFEAEEVVSFGDGFRVAKGARVTVGVRPESPGG